LLPLPARIGCSSRLEIQFNFFVRKLDVVHGLAEKAAKVVAFEGI